MKCRYYSFALMLMAVPGMQAWAETPSALTVSAVHWQEGMVTGVVTFGGKLNVQRPAWVWSGVAGTDTRLVPVFSSTGLTYSLSAGTPLPVLGGYTERLFSPEHVTLRPLTTPGEVGLSPGPGGDEYRRAAVRGFTAGGKIRQGEMTFRVRHILACQDRAMAVSGQGWRRLSDNGDPSGPLSRPLVREINSLFLSVTGYDYPLDASGVPLPPASVVMECQTVGFRSVSPAAAPEIQGEGIAGASLMVLEDVRFRFPESGEAVTGWQAGFVPEVTYR